MPNTNKPRSEDMHQLKNEIDLLKNQLIQEKQKNNFLDNLIALIPGHIYWLNTKNEFLGCNNTQAKTAQLNSRQEIVGKTNYDMPWKNQAAELNRANDLVIQTGKTQIQEEIIDTKEGQKIYLSHKEPLRDENQNIMGVLGVSLDISQIKKLEFELRESKNLAEAANQAKTEFLANMRHDIRTPLSGIVGFSELLKSESKEPHIKEYADNLMASSHALLELMDEVLEAVRVSSGEIPMLKRKFNLAQTVEQVTALYLAKAHEKHLKLSLNIDSKLPDFVIGDKIRLHRIMLELVGNALNFTDEGHVTIDVTLAKQKNRNLVIKITISDSGMGIPKDRQQDIYVQFKRLTPSYQGIYKGAGLGLYVVKQFIDELEGEIYVESEPRKGTCFTCLIPLQESLLDDASGMDTDEQLKIEKPYMAPLTIQPISLAKNPDINALTRVLVVEDNIIAQMVAKSILSAMDCHVDVASSGEEALIFCSNIHYDLILMDIGLGEGMDGYDVTHHIRTKHEKMQHTPIIALTAHAADENKQRCIKAGMNAVLTKPLTQAHATDILKTFVPARQNPLQPVIQPARLDLPDNDEEMFQLEQFALFDEEQGIKNCGDKETLIELLTMTAQQLPEDLQRMKQAFEAQDYPLMEQLTHKIKGGAVYVGTTRMKYACQYVERYWKTGEREWFDKLCHQAVEVIEDTRTCILEWLKNQSET